MTIKHAEVTIIRNLEEETFVQYYIVRTLFNQEGEFTDNDTIIMLFDDFTIYDSKNEIKTKNKIIFNETEVNGFPIYFDYESNNTNITAFYKYPTETEGKQSLNMKPFIHNYRQAKHVTLEPSFYNLMYECDGKDIFGIVKIKSNEDKPRFIVAYDDMYFEKNDIIFLTDCMLKRKCSK